MLRKNTYRSGWRRASSSTSWWGFRRLTVGQTFKLLRYVSVLGSVPVWSLGDVGRSPSEFYALGCILGIECVGIFNEQVRVEQFVPVFFRIGSGRLGAAEVNYLLVARHDGIDRRILPRPQTFEAKLVFVIGERSGNVYGEEQRYNLTDHVPSLRRIPAGADARVSPAPLFLRQSGIFECK